MYISLGLIVGLYYGSSAEQTCTLNWSHYNGRADPSDAAPGWAKFISYLVVLFPPIGMSAWHVMCSCGCARCLVCHVLHVCGVMFHRMPPPDVLSAYPLNCITLGNNLVTAFVTDPVKLTRRRYIIPFRLISCVLPLCGAMVVKDLGREARRGEAI